MTEAIRGLEPQIFWRCFAAVAAIPRPSGHEERLAEYILKRAGELGLEGAKDGCGNVVVRLPATPGREGAPSVCLQSHLDMVCEKNADKVHDFMSDPIELVRRGDVLTANGTTLGADNGIGVATSLAIMEGGSGEHGPLELLFTVEEETGLRGAKNLSPALVGSGTLLNLDSEEEGALYIGCAGGKDTVGRWPLATEPAPGEAVAFRLSVKGLKGGHSGLDIDKGLGNAIKLLNRALLRMAELGARLASIDGGNMRNAIPRECAAVLYLPSGQQGRGEELVTELEETFKAESAGVDPGVRLTIAREVAASEQVLEWDLQRCVTRAIAALPSGVQRMSSDIPGLVETSTNVSVVSTTGDAVVLITSQRSSSASRLAEIVQTVESTLKLSGAEIEASEGYPGWQPDMDSHILKVAKGCYRHLYGRDPEVKAVHAGLECGIIGERIPGIDMISFGPNMEKVHSPDERVYIESVGNYWKFLLEVLKAV